MSSHLIRSDLDPIITGYLLLMAILAAGLAGQRRRAAAGRPQGRAAGQRAQGWRAVLLHVAADVLGGYVLLMAVVVGYYYGVARVGSDFLASAVSGSAVLLAISLPVFALASWLSWRRGERQHGRRDRAGPRP